MDEVSKDRVVVYGKIWLNRVALALAGLLMVPTLMILATWNTLPGQKLYPVKSYLEEMALKLVGDNFTVKADLQTQFVKRRFNEAQVLLTQSSSAGLGNLSQQVEVTTAEIVAASSREGTKDAAAAPEKAEKLAAQLKEYDQQLEEAKSQIVTSGAPPVQESPAAVPESETERELKESPSPDEEAAGPTEAEKEVPKEVAEVEETQAEIKKAIGKLEKVAERKSEKMKEWGEQGEEESEQGRH